MPLFAELGKQQRRRENALTDDDKWHIIYIALVLQSEIQNIERWERAVSPLPTPPKSRSAYNKGLVLQCELINSFLHSHYSGNYIWTTLLARFCLCVCWDNCSLIRQQRGASGAVLWALNLISCCGQSQSPRDKSWNTASHVVHRAAE